MIPFTIGNGLERKPGTHVYLDSEKGKQKGLTAKEAKAEEEENQLIRMLLEEHQPKSKLKSKEPKTKKQKQGTQKSTKEHGKDYSDHDDHAQEKQSGNKTESKGNDDDYEYFWYYFDDDANNKTEGANGTVVEYGKDYGIGHANKTDPDYYYYYYYDDKADGNGKGNGSSKDTEYGEDYGIEHGNDEFSGGMGGVI